MHTGVLISLKGGLNMV